MCTADCARIVLFVFNFIFWLAGGGVLAIGVWMKLDSTIVNYLHVVNIHQADPLIDHAGLIFIIVGAVIFLVGFLGCCGALRGSQAILFLYAFCVLSIMILELAAGILALLFRNKVKVNLQESMREQIRSHYDNTTATGAAWDFLQVKLKCCGGDGVANYENSKWWNETRVESNVVPLTCCVLVNDDPHKPVPKDASKCQQDAEESLKDSEFYHKKPCVLALGTWFESHSLIMMCIGFVVGGIQIIGFTTACCLRSALKKESLNRIH